MTSNKQTYRIIYPDMHSFEATIAQWNLALSHCYQAIQKGDKSNDLRAFDTLLQGCKNRQNFSEDLLAKIKRLFPLKDLDSVIGHGISRHEVLSLIEVAEEIIATCPSLCIEYLKHSDNRKMNMEKRLKLLHLSIKHASKLTFKEQAEITQESFQMIRAHSSSDSGHHAAIKREVSEKPASIEYPKDIYLSRNQKEIYQMIAKMVMIFQDKRWKSIKLKPRLWPLICGATGSGKSTLISRYADIMGYKYLPITYGDWVAKGARDEAGTPTKKHIVEEAMNTDFLLLHIDELDKWSTQRSAWGSCITNDLWNTLDLKFIKEDFPIGEYSDETLKKIQSKIFIIGSGTWQDLFEKKVYTQLNPTQKTIGFGELMAQNKEDSMSSLSESNIRDIIATQDKIPRELMARFHTDLQILTYPEQDEIPGILKHTGIQRLAKSLNEKIDSQDVFKHGWRGLETLLNRFLIKQARLELNNNTKKHIQI